MKNNTAALSFAILLIILAGCETTPETIKIGYIGPLSGPSAVLGMDAIKAIEIAANEINNAGGINGAKIQIIAEDDQYIPAKTLTAYEKLTTLDEADIILVSTYGGVFTIADRAKEDNVIIIDPLDCNNELAALNDNIFCIATETESIGRSLAEHLAENNGTKAALLYSTKDNFMSLVAKSFTERFAQTGGQTKEESFAYTDSDFKTQLVKISQFKPDAVVFLGHDETGTAMKQARELGITAQFMATGTVTSPGLQQSAAGAAEGTLFAYWEPTEDNTLAQAFEQQFVSLVGRPPILPLTTHPAYDSMQVLRSALFAAGGQNSEAVKQKIYATRNLQGTTGTLTMDPDGAIRIEEEIFILQNGMPVRVD